MRPGTKLTGRIQRLLARGARGGHPPTIGAGAVITLRVADCGEDAAIEPLVQLSGGATPPGPSLVAEVDGRPWAALSLAGGELLADPFRPTAELAPLLSLRAAQIHASNAARGRAQRAPVLPLPRARRAARAESAVQRLHPPQARAEH